MVHPRPKPWNIGITDNIDVPGNNLLQTAKSWNTNELKFILDKIIPLGLPVVPPLYSITAGS